MQAAGDLEDSVTLLTGQLLNSTGTALPTMARAVEASLRELHQLTAELLRNREGRRRMVEEYEALSARASSSQRIVQGERQQVHRCELEFKQVVQRFGEIANQLLIWISILLPKLRMLEASRAELSAVLQLRERLPELDAECVAAEDDVDAAEAEVRRQQRHAKVSRAPRPGKGHLADAAAVALQRQCELRAERARERAKAATGQLQEAERRLQEAEGALPLVLDPEESAGSQESPSSPRSSDGLSPEDCLAKKVAALEHLQEDVAVQVSEAHAEHSWALRLAADQRADRLLWKQVEPDFMCPILHERMIEPVLAADGQTYERSAIEKWLQQHNTSPMTGAPLAHRYLTENFALRRLIAAHNVGKSQGQGCGEEEELSTCP